jgi:glucose-1-phosphate adenylyltransferase
VVEDGAEVHESVILHDCVVEAGARVERAILDVEARIGTRATAGAGKGARASVGEEDIVVVGRGAEVAPRSTLEPGERLSPASSEA